ERSKQRSDARRFTDLHRPLNLAVPAPDHNAVSRGDAEHLGVRTVHFEVTPRGILANLWDTISHGPCVPLLYDTPGCEYVRKFGIDHVTPILIRNKVNCRSTVGFTVKISTLPRFDERVARNVAPHSPRMLLVRTRPLNPVGLAQTLARHPRKVVFGVTRKLSILIPNFFRRVGTDQLFVAQALR